MSELLEKLGLFFDKVKNITIWERVFPWLWKSVRNLSYEAYTEYKHLAESLTQANKEAEMGRTNTATLKQENEQLKINSARLEIEIKQLKVDLEKEKTATVELKGNLSAQTETIRQWEKNLTDKQIEISRLTEKLDRLTQESSVLKTEIAGLKKTETNMLKQYEDKGAALHNTQLRIENEREQEKEIRHAAEIQKITALKETWAIHETTVKETIKAICQKHIIEYIEKPPFRGNPDNTIKICDEYVIFDAKSPGTEDLRSFSKYIHNQTEAVKKYADQEDVKRDIFLVVPFNTVDVIDRFSFNMGAYNVYVITVDALEPIILSLRKIEDYQFAKELTPEERENICGIIGKFAHTTKRRIQIDYFFAHQFLDILTKCESDIPRDMIDKVGEFEKAEKLNPPIEKRAKQISSKELVEGVGRIRQETEAKEVVFPTTIAEDIKSLPLYKENKSEEPNGYD